MPTGPRCRVGDEIRTVAVQNKAAVALGYVLPSGVGMGLKIIDTLVVE